MDAQNSLRRTILLLSGKGGVGVSHLAINLAPALRRRNTAVTLIDPTAADESDLLLLDQRFEIESSETARDTWHIATSPEDVRLGNASTPTGEGPMNGSPRAVTLIDVGCASGDEIVAWHDTADVLLLVTTAEPPSVIDSYAALKAIHETHPPRRVCVVFNAVEDVSAAHAAMERLTRTCSEFLHCGIEPLGWIPLDRTVRRSVNERVPIVVGYPRSPAARAIVAIADAIVGRPMESEHEPTIFERVASLFV